MRVFQQFFSLNNSVDVIKISTHKINTETENAKINVSPQRISIFAKERPSVSNKKLSVSN